MIRFPLQHLHNLARCKALFWVPQPRMEWVVVHAAAPGTFFDALLPAHQEAQEAI